LFRAFLGYNKAEIDNLSIQEYIDSSIMLTETLKLMHAPFQKQDN